MEEETYHDLDLDYVSTPALSEEVYSEFAAPDLDQDYQAYIDASGSLGDAYFTPAEYEDYGSESGESSDSRPRTTVRPILSHAGIYGGGTGASEFEKEIDYLPIKDWQGELSALMRMDDSLEKWRGIARLGLDFQHAAGLYARVIVSECKLPENQKTIHSADIGGVAGGTN